MTQKEFWDTVKVRYMDRVKTNISHYLRKIPSNMKEYYMLGKITEEVGELIQAVHASNFSPNVYKKYDDIRGTVESEAADVIITCMGYFSVTGKIPCHITMANNGEGEVLLFTIGLLRYVESLRIGHLMLLVFNYFDTMELDLCKAVEERLTFNTELVRKERLKEARLKREAKVNAGKI